MSTTERCDYCDGRFDRPALHGCDDARHLRPDLAQRIVRAIEYDLNDREGMSFSDIGVSRDVQDEIREEWAELIHKELATTEP